MDLSFISGDWRQIQVDDAAGQLVHSSLTALQSLVKSLLQGHVLLGNLQTCLKYKHQFQLLYQQCMHHNIKNSLSSLICPESNGIVSSTGKKNIKSETVPVDADVVLARREANLKPFMLRAQQIDTLIKMVGKVTESITGWYGLKQRELRKISVQQQLCSSGSS